MSPLAALKQVVDAMRRSDPEYVQSHGCKPCTDEEWNDALQQAEDVIEANE